MRSEMKIYSHHALGDLICNSIYCLSLHWEKSINTWRYLLLLSNNILENSIAIKQNKCSWQALKITAIQIWQKSQWTTEKTKIDVSRCQQYLGKSDKKMHYFPWKWKISCITLKQTILWIHLHVKLASSSSCPWSTGV